MQIFLFIILFPFTVLRFILLAITLFTVKYFLRLSILPYSLLWINDLILQLLSFGSIPALKQDSIIVNNAMNKNDQNQQEQKDDFLIFVNMTGAGTITCNDCNYEENIIAFTHGFDENDCTDSNTGYQCQSCGKFQALTQCDINEKKFTCECGGLLDREKPLFCPQCKSKNVIYGTKYIT